MAQKSAHVAGKSGSFDPVGTLGQASPGRGRAHRMGADDVRVIVEAIRSHQERKFGWSDVERMSQRIVPGGFTRQALMAHPEIYAVYTEKKQSLHGGRQAVSVEQSLRAKIAGLQSALQKLRLQVARYQVNAAMFGISAEYLNRPLPRSAVERTMIQKAERARLDQKQQKRIDAQRKRATERT